jgi:hypothetical protein
MVGVAGELAVETESMAEDEAEGAHGRADGLPTLREARKNYDRSSTITPGFAAIRGNKNRRGRRRCRIGIMNVFLTVRDTSALGEDLRRKLLQDWPPVSTVTARRFCDQQELSLQLATGRSLP